MILRNYCNKVQWLRTISGNYQHYYKLTSGTIKNANELQQPPSSASCNAYGENNSNNVALNYLAIALGSGTTAPTFDDYKLETPILTLTDGGHSLNIGSDYSNNSTCTYQQIVTNNTEAPITVSEVGIVTAYSATTASNYASILFTRDIITPVTIGVGETKTFVVTIDFADMSTTASVS